MIRLCNPCATRRLNNPYNALLNIPHDHGTADAIEAKELAQ